MTTAKDMVEMLRNPVVMPGVQQRKADQLAADYPELAVQLAGLLEFELAAVARMPHAEMPERTRRLLAIVRILAENA